MFPRSLRILFFFFLAIIILFSVVPFLTLAVRSVLHSVDFGLLLESGTLRSVVDTLSITLSAAILALLIAVPLSWILVRTDIPMKEVFRKALIYPYFIPPYLFAVAWTMLAIPRVGFLNRLFEGSPFNIYSFWGLVWVFANAYVPVILSPLCQRMDTMDPSLEESARVCGAGPIRTFFSVTLPCLLPTVASSALLFSLAVMAAFGIPAIIGNPARIFVLTTRIYTQAKMGGIYGIDGAFVISIWLLLFTAMLLYTNAWISRRHSYRLTTGKAPKQSIFSLGPKLKWFIFLYVFFAGFALVALPIFAIVFSSFLKVAGDISITNLTLNNYRYLFQMPEMFRALGNSLLLAFITAVACCVIGFFIAYFKERTPFLLRGSLMRMASWPFAIPGTIVALAIIVSFGMGWGTGYFSLLGTLSLLLIAYISKYLALSVQTLAPALSAIDASLDEAGRVFGASPWGVIRKILVPLLFPALISMMVLTSLPVLSELTMSVLLAGPGTETLGTLMFQLQEYANPLAACALATVLLLIVSFFLFLQDRLVLWMARS